MFKRFLFPLMLLLLLTTQVSAHSFFVTGVITTTPTPAPVGQAFILQIGMTDPSGAPVEDAIVSATFTKDAFTSTYKFSPSGVPGLYSINVTLPEEGVYKLLLKDTTFGTEQGRATEANVEFTLEPNQPQSTAFIFPPTRTSTNNLSTWLIWVIGIPVLAGIIVTVLVLLNTKDKTADTETKDNPSSN
jgi:YtkA-like